VLDLPVKLVAEFRVGPANVLPLRSQEEGRQQQFATAIGTLRVGADITVPEAQRLSRILCRCPTEARHQSCAKRPDPRLAFGLDKKAVDLAERRAPLSHVEEHVGPPTRYAGRLGTRNVGKDGLIQVRESLLPLALTHVKLGQGIVGFRKVRVQPQSFVIVLDRSLLIAKPLKARSEILMALRC
jgi:hypothetical protein